MFGHVCKFEIAIAICESLVFENQDCSGMETVSVWCGVLAKLFPFTHLMTKHLNVSTSIVRSVVSYVLKFWDNVKKNPGKF